MTAPDWQPGDPVYPDQVEPYGSCGPCQVRWTTEVDHCPDCGEPSTESLRAAIGRLRARHPLEIVYYPPANGGPQRFCRECERLWPCHEIAALDGVEAG